MLRWRNDGRKNMSKNNFIVSVCVKWINIRWLINVSASESHITIDKTPNIMILWNHLCSLLIRYEFDGIFFFCKIGHSKNGWPRNERWKEMQNIVAKFDAKRQGLPKCLWKDKDTFSNREGHTVGDTKQIPMRTYWIVSFTPDYTGFRTFASIGKMHYRMV